MEMISCKVNGKQAIGEAGRNLLAFLREDLRLTAVKNGCGSGACGTCTVLIDGKPQRSCITPLGKVGGRDILTVEGLSGREKEVYAYAFAEAGAVQCGFCIPGMVLSAKSLLDNDSFPDEDTIRKALRSNICRCTGYKKIIGAIKIAAGLFQEEEKKFYHEQTQTRTFGTHTNNSEISKNKFVKVRLVRG